MELNDFELCILRALKNSTGISGAMLNRQFGHDNDLRIIMNRLFDHGYVTVNSWTKDWDLDFSETIYYVTDKGLSVFNTKFDFPDPIKPYWES